MKCVSYGAYNDIIQFAYICDYVNASSECNMLIVDCLATTCFGRCFFGILTCAQSTPGVTWLIITHCNTSSYHILSWYMIICDANTHQFIWWYCLDVHHIYIYTHTMYICTHTWLFESGASEDHSLIITFGRGMASEGGRPHLSARWVPWLPVDR